MNEVLFFTTLSPALVIFILCDIYYSHCSKAHYYYFFIYLIIGNGKHYFQIYIYIYFKYIYIYFKYFKYIPAMKKCLFWSLKSSLKNFLSPLIFFSWMGLFVLSSSFGNTLYVLDISHFSAVWYDVHLFHSVQCVFLLALILQCRLLQFHVFIYFFLPLISLSMA